MLGAFCKRITAGLLVAAGVGFVAMPGVASATSGPTSATSLPGSQPSWATSNRSVGAETASTVRTFQVNLPLAQGAEAFAAAVSNPKSARYGQYLSPAAFDARFAPSGTQVQTVKAWLSSKGFNILSVPGNNRYVEADGTVAQINQAFGTVITRYNYQGQRLDSPNSDLSVPSSVAPDILAVTGLDDGTALIRPDHVTSDTGTTVGNAPQAGRNTVNTPCSTYYGQHVVTMPAAYGVKKFPTNICGYTATQLEEGYGIGSAIATGNDGSGVKVAITDAYASSTIANDANAFSSLEGIPTLKPGQLTQVLAKQFDMQNACGGAAGWNLEETLDVEAVHTTAPGANIVYVGAKNCANGLGIDAVNDVVANHLADIVTDSWSEGTENLPPSALNAEHAIWVQGASEGIGFNFSSGDDGDLLAVTGETQPSVPASDPEVTAVGGTSLAVGQGGNYESETGWGNDRAPVAYDPSSGAPVGYGLPLPGEFYAGAGGGTSHVFAEPSYQDGVVPSSLADEYGTPSRVVPDVSALADPYTGMEEVETVNGSLTEFAIGGTSLSSPLFAGIEALADQSRNAAIGFANPLLYSISGTDAFHDVTPTVSPVALAFTSTNPASLCYDSCLITQGHDTSLQTTAGFDNVTGIGSPNGTDFIKGLAQAS